LVTNTFRLATSLAVATVTLVLCSAVLAHNVSRADIALIVGKQGWHFLLYVWLGAKHMVTGYDHLLFLLGVVFYLRNLRTVALYVSLCALGHSITLIAGVVFQLQVNPYLIDAIIGLSVAYKGFDNLGGFTALLGENPGEKTAVLIFGLFHGLGLATKLQDLGLAENGLLANLLSFNLGVELGQLAALLIILFLLRLLPNHLRGSSFGIAVNVFLLIAGFALMAYQITLYSQI
jgi:HupE / UreJ protein